jgi:hypothetical protein
MTTNRYREEKIIALSSVLIDRLYHRGIVDLVRDDSLIKELEEEIAEWRWQKYLKRKKVRVNNGKNISTAK